MPELPQGFKLIEMEKIKIISYNTDIEEHSKWNGK